MSLRPPVNRANFRANFSIDDQHTPEIDSNEIIT